MGEVELVKRKKEPCACPKQGGMCGDQSYDEMFEAMLASKMDSQNTYHRLREIHLKWKKLGTQAR